jgi:RNA-directed DNA polymerase
VKAMKEKAERLKRDIVDFLNRELGLELSEEKTLVTSVEDGFDFLGFNIRRYKKVALIKASRKAIERFKEQVRERVKAGFVCGDVAGIIHLNRYLNGWAGYYRRVSSSDTFCSLDHFVWHTVWRQTERLRGIRPRNRSRRAHYAEHLIPYRLDIHKPNRWSRSKHYGIWADEEHTVAYIVTSLRFHHIRYAKRHPQLHPYLPGEREELAKRTRQLETPKGVKPDLPVYDRYGPEWQIVRKEALQRADFRCINCGNPIKGRRATVHHQKKLKGLKSREQANRLENLLVLCPKCHKALENED